VLSLDSFGPSHQQFRRGLAGQTMFKPQVEAAISFSLRLLQRNWMSLPIPGYSHSIIPPPSSSILDTQIEGRGNTDEIPLTSSLAILQGRFVWIVPLFPQFDFGLARVLALTLEINQNKYRVTSVIDLDMAYARARLLGCIPQARWLDKD
jgi:hypothetical protein